MQGKVGKFHLGLNQTLSHYVKKYGSSWDDFVNYALMAHLIQSPGTVRFTYYTGERWGYPPKLNRIHEANDPESIETRSSITLIQ
jgi:hypothetical protein